MGGTATKTCKNGFSNPNSCAAAVSWAKSHETSTYHSDYSGRCDHVLALAYGWSASGSTTAHARLGPALVPDQALSALRRGAATHTGTVIPRCSKPVLLVLALALLAGGCSGKAKAPVPHTAAEPAVAPSTAGAPAGTVVAVGSQPQGIVYDPVTGLVAVAVRSPDRLVLIDGATMHIRQQIPLAGHARHLQLAKPGGPVIVPEEDKNQLALVSLSTGATTVIKTGTSPHDAAAVSGGYVAGDEFGSSITIARTGKTPQTVGGVEQPGGVIDLGDTVAIVDVKGYTISTYRVSDGALLAKSAAGAGPTHGVKAADGTVLVTDTRGNQVLDFNTNPLAQQASLPLPGSPYGLAADSKTPLVWVTLTARNQVVGLTLAAGRIREVARLDTVQQPDTVAVAPGSNSLWIAGDAGGVVQKLTR